MYNEKLAVAIKSAGKVLREFNKDSVYVPFGAEYSIFIKNLNSVRALVKVSIDGQNVDQSGEGFVINANSSLDLERFLKNGNLNQGNRFKFIERTGKIEQHRGIEVEDGLIRVEFQFEKPLPKVEFQDVHHYERHIYHRDWDHYWHRPYWPYRPYWYGDVTYTSGGAAGGNLIGSTGAGVGSVSGQASGGASYNASADSVNLDASDVGDTIASLTTTSHPGVPVSANYRNVINEAGITVPGSKSDQQFVTVGSFPLEDATHVIVLKLLGETAQGKRVAKAVTVKTTQRCVTCGHVNKATAKFCTECGTGLEIV